MRSNDISHMITHVGGIPNTPEEDMSEFIEGLQSAVFPEGVIDCGLTEFGFCFAKSVITDQLSD